MAEISPPQLSPDERRAMLRLARESLRHYLATRKPLSSESIEAYAIGATNEQACNLFVSLHLEGKLRGCIGTLSADLPLARAVARAAVRAGTADTRFPAMTLDELARCVIEISVLSDFTPIRDICEIEVGVHGLLVEEEGARGLLLPQVAARYRWDASEFLRQAHIKAGLQPRTSLDKSQASVFTAVIFSEAEFDRLP